MIIESIELKNYRNYDKLHMDFSHGTNILYGDNAQGKTNILEAIYVCATTKSHRGSKDKEIIQFDRDESHIKLNVRKRDVPYRIDMHLKKNRAKGVAVNGVPIKKASELFGIVNVVFFSPEDLNLIKNGPAERRRFIDLELCQLNKLYVHSLVQYNKIVTQRNKLLKDIMFRPDYEETLDIWDMQLVQYGREVIRCREAFVGQLNDLIGGIHRQLSGEKESLHISYEPNVTVDMFEDTLRKSRPSDLKQRTAALSLKLAEIELVKKIVNDYPILLLDDVLSELDGSRQNHLLSGINHIQTMITCTGLEDFVNNRFRIDKIFKVVSGEVYSEN